MYCKQSVDTTVSVCGVFIKLSLAEMACLVQFHSIYLMLPNLGLCFHLVCFVMAWTALGII